MPEARFGGKQGTVLKLKESPDLLAVRTRSQRPLLDTVVASAETAALDDMDPVLAFPEAGVEVFRSRSKTSIEAAKAAIRSAPDTRFAGRVLVTEQGEEPVLYTENIFIKFKEDLTEEECEAILRDKGLEIKSRETSAVNAYFAAAPEGTGQRVFDIANELLSNPDVELCHPELIRERRNKAIHALQWHLQASTIAGQTINAHANAAPAHALATGEGITVAIIDDGVDIDHPEFTQAGKVVAPRDATLLTSDPRPKTGNNHGTACAGVAVASGVSASGVAPAARLMPIRLASGLGSMRESQAFDWAVQNGADVISCSWGPVDGLWYQPSDPAHNQVVPIGDNTRLAIENAIQNGRGGKGCLVLFAAGNGNESVDNDGYASDKNVIAVAACNDRGTRSIYSDFGKAVFCAFPSSDQPFPAQSHPAPLTTGIYTTDRRGPVGYNRGGSLAESGADSDGNYTSSFGGTSSACPGAAGVAALVMSRNPSLTGAQVKEILRKSCDRIDPSGGQYDTNGRSKKYGFGRLNALRAVQLAVEQQPSNTISLSRSVNQPILDFGQTSATLSVDETALVQDVKVSVELDHSFVGDLVLRLVGPGTPATSVELQSRRGGSQRNLRKQFTTAAVADLAKFRGKSGRGTWKLEVEDKAAADQGTLLKFGLELTFAAAVPHAVPAAPIAAAAGNGAPRKGSRSKKAAKARTTADVAKIYG